MATKLVWFQLAEKLVGGKPGSVRLEAVRLTIAVGQIERANQSSRIRTGSGVDRGNGQNVGAVDQKSGDVRLAILLPGVWIFHGQRDLAVDIQREHVVARHGRDRLG